MDTVNNPTLGRGSLGIKSVIHLAKVPYSTCHYESRIFALNHSRWGSRESFFIIIFFSLTGWSGNSRGQRPTRWTRKTRPSWHQGGHRSCRAPRKQGVTRIPWAPGPSWTPRPPWHSGKSAKNSWSSWLGLTTCPFSNESSCNLSKWIKWAKLVSTREQQLSFKLCAESSAKYSLNVPSLDPHN